MLKKDYELIAKSIWRSGYIKDKDKKRQEAREKMRRLIAFNIASELKEKDPCFDKNKFYEECGIESYNELI